MWDAVDERMQELLGPGVVTATFKRYDRPPPFDIDMNEMAEYAMDNVGRRLGAIETARGADMRAIDLDASPDALEECFHAEDAAQLVPA